MGKLEQSFTTPPLPQISSTIKNALTAEKLDKLSVDERTQLLDAVCTSLSLNPLTSPFKIINLQGKTRIYASKDATDQLRKVYGVSAQCKSRSTQEGIHTVEVEVSDPMGRRDFATGAVTVSNLKGDNLANAIMKAETKAKRRATLSICGLGLLDESEVETIPGHVQMIDTPKHDDTVRHSDAPPPVDKQGPAPSPEQKMEKDPDQPEPSPTYITLKESKALFAKVKESGVETNDFREFMQEVSSGVFKEDPPINRTSQIKKEQYGYYLDAVTESEAGITAIKEWLKAGKPSLG